MGDATTVTDTPKHSVSVAGVVINTDGHILTIQRRDNGQWEPPGGVLEMNETPQAGVAREVLEETGLRVDVGALSGVYKNMRRGIVSLVFECRLVSGTARPTNESQAIEWLTLKEVESHFLPAYAIRVADAFLPGVQVRAHDGYRLIDG